MDPATLIFRSEMCRDWARSHRHDPPIMRADPEYTHILQSLEECNIRSLALSIASSESEQEAPGGQNLDAIEHEYTRLRWQIAPIRWLPDELLSRIFIAMHHHKNSNFLANIECLRLTCSHWNNVVLDTPRCWDVIKIPMLEGDSGELLWPKSLVQISTWLQRSKTVQLRVCLHEKTRWKLDYPKPSVPLLIKHVSRWGFLAIGDSDIVSTVSEMLEEEPKALGSVSTSSQKLVHFPKLHRLKIYESGFSSADTVYPGSSFIERGFWAPLLTCMKLIDVYFDPGSYATTVASTPALEHLFLEGGFYRTTSASSFSLSHGRMNHLCLRYVWGGVPEPDEDWKISPHLIRDSIHLAYLQVWTCPSSEYGNLAGPAADLDKMAIRAPLLEILDLNLQSDRNDTLIQRCAGLHHLGMPFSNLRILTLTLSTQVREWVEHPTWETVARMIIEDLFRLVLQLCMIMEIPLDIRSLVNAAVGLEESRRDAATHLRMSGEGTSVVLKQLLLQIQPVRIPGLHINTLTGVGYTLFNRTECCEAIASSPLASVTGDFGY